MGEMMEKLSKKYDVAVQNKALLPTRVEKKVNPFEGNKGAGFYVA